MHYNCDGFVDFVVRALPFHLLIHCANLYQYNIRWKLHYSHLRAEPLLEYFESLEQVCNFEGIPICSPPSTPFFASLYTIGIKRPRYILPPTPTLLLSATIFVCNCVVRVYSPSLNSMIRLSLVVRPDDHIVISTLHDFCQLG
jgi:hypothetical protein